MGYQGEQLHLVPSLQTTDASCGLFVLVSWQIVAFVHHVFLLDSGVKRSANKSELIRVLHGMWKWFFIDRFSKGPPCYVNMDPSEATHTWHRLSQMFAQKSTQIVISELHICHFQSEDLKPRARSLKYGLDNWFLEGRWVCGGHVVFCRVIVSKEDTWQCL